MCVSTCTGHAMHTLNTATEQAFLYINKARKTCISSHKFEILAPEF